MAPNMNLDLNNFRKLCGVSIIVEQDGSNPVLCVSANVREKDGQIHEFKRCVALTPLMEMLADKIREYHDLLHVQTNVSGLSDDIAAARARATKSSRAKTWRTSRHGRTLDPMTPGSRSVRTKLPPPDDAGDGDDGDGDYDDGPSGDKVWSGIHSKLDALRQRLYLDAPENLPPLRPGEDPLQVQGWFDSIQDTVRHLAESKAVKSLYHELKNVAESRKYQEMALGAVIGPEAAKYAIDAAHKVHGLIIEAKNGNPHALDSLQNLKNAADSGNQVAAQVYESAQHINDMLKAKEAAASKPQTQVSGWLYNRPYRSNAQVLLDAATGRFPTVSMAVREGWHDGLNFAATMQRKKLGFGI